MSIFKKFLDKEYRADPTGLSRFATAACTLVRINRRWWRGYKTMDKAEITVAGEQIKSDNTTQPRWKLIPDQVKEEFVNFEKAVDILIRANCVFASEDENGRLPLLTGGGNYAVDAANWPRVKALLRQAQQKWGECADRWCTDDGYKEFHQLLKDKYGETDYDRVRDLVPPAKKLRRCFGLDVVVLPIRLAEDVGDDPDAEVGRREAITELLETAVRRPREDAAAAWRNLAEQLVEFDNGRQALVARTVWRTVDGQKTPGARRVQGRSVAAARAATDALSARSGRYMEPALVDAVQAVLGEIPAGDGPAKSAAAKLNMNDTDALRVGKMLLDAAAVADDEAGMCLGVADAVKSARPAAKK